MRLRQLRKLLIGGFAANRTLYPRAGLGFPRHFSFFGKKRTKLDNEKAKQIKGIIAEVVGFDQDDISDEDKFIVDYKITYGERKSLLERLNQQFQKEYGFDEFCKMDKVSDVVEAYLGATVKQS
jgi:acyl carrier protein